MRNARLVAALPLILLMVTVYAVAAILGVLADVVSGEKLSRHLFS